MELGKQYLGIFPGYSVFWIRHASSNAAMVTLVSESRTSVQA